MTFLKQAIYSNGIITFETFDENRLLIITTSKHNGKIISEARIDTATLKISINEVSK